MPAKTLKKKEPVKQKKLSVVQQTQQLSTETLMAISKMQDDADEFSKTLDMKKFDAVKNTLVQMQKKHVEQAIVNFEFVDKIGAGFKAFPQMKANNQVQE